MKFYLLRFLSFLMLAGLALSACIPVGSAPETGATPTGTEPSLPPTGATDTPAASTGRIEGLVWHDVCAIAGGEGGVPATPSAGCIDKEGAFQANGVLDPGEPGIEGVVVDLGQGACPAKGLATATTNTRGEFVFGDLPAGDYCVSIDPAGGPNESILIPGMWTSIATDLAETSLTLNPGESKTGVHFGWDYQFLPAPENPAPTGTAIGDLEPFKAWLSENLSSQNYAELQKLMTDPFWLGGWQSEAQSFPPAEAIEQVKNYRGSGNIEIINTTDPASFLGGEDPRRYLSPEVKNPEVMLVRGMGEQGQDGAILILAQQPDGSYAWYGMLIVRGGFNAAPPPVSEVEPFKAWLSENIAARNYEELRKLMGDQFWFAMWQSEGGPETPDNAIRLLQGFFGDNQIEFLPPGDPEAVLGFDPLAIVGSDVKGPDVLLARNVGTEGKDGAVLYVAQNPDGTYYWYGLLIVRGGFQQ
jgi:hypothetical protein